MRIRIILMLQISDAGLKDFLIADLRFRIRTLNIMIADLRKRIETFETWLRNCGFRLRNLKSGCGFRTLKKTCDAQH